MSASMAVNAIIDLSLSTDDEGDLPGLPSLKHAEANISPAGSGFINLSDEFGAFAQFDEECPEQPSKKRRLSPLTAKMGRTTARTTESIKKTASSKAHASIDGRSGRDKIGVLHSDSIIFTSSPHPIPKRPKRFEIPQSPRIDGSDCDELPDNISKIAAPRPSMNTQLSSRTTALLANISTNARPRKKTSSGAAKNKSDERTSAKRHSDVGKKATEYAKRTIPDPPVLSSSVDQVKKVRKNRLSSVERRAIEQDRELVKVRKAKEREEEKEKRRLLKEEKAREKQIAADLAEVNKARTDKKTSTPEMIVDLPASIKGRPVETSIVTVLKGLNVKTTIYESPMPDIIKWRRKVTARFNEEKGHWEPVAEAIHDETHVMCLLSAKDFVSMASANPRSLDGQTVEAHVLKLKEAFPSRTLIFMIEGLDAYMKKSKNAKNRAYQAAVLGQMDSISNSVRATSSRRKNATEEIADEDVVEDALLRLQVIHGCLIHHTATTDHTVEWITKFTQHISTIPYKNQQMRLDTSFCMDVGQVKTGQDKDDTYVKMLQEIVRVTVPVARGVAAEYSNVISLVEGMRHHGPLLLEDLKKSANANGALTDARIGPALSKRLYKVFMGKNPSSTDI